MYIYIYIYMYYLHTYIALHYLTLHDMTFHSLHDSNTMCYICRGCLRSMGPDWHQSLERSSAELENRTSQKASRVNG